MAEAAVQLKVGGQTYRVVTSAATGELERLAQVVEGVLVGVTAPGRQPSPQALVLAAITLAHELEEERLARAEAEERYRRALTALLARVDRVIEGTGLPTMEPPALGRVGSTQRWVHSKRVE